MTIYRKLRNANLYAACGLFTRTIFSIAPKHNEHKQSSHPTFPQKKVSFSEPDLVSFFGPAVLQILRVPFGIMGEVAYPLIPIFKEAVYSYTEYSGITRHPLEPKAAKKWP